MVMVNNYKKWCNRCQRYHTSPPVDIKGIIKQHSDEIAREIDQEILRGLVATEPRVLRGLG